MYLDEFTETEWDTYYTALDCPLQCTVCNGFSVCVCGRVLKIWAVIDTDPALKSAQLCENMSLRSNRFLLLVNTQTLAQ